MFNIHFLITEMKTFWRRPLTQPNVLLGLALHPCLSWKEDPFSLSDHCIRERIFFTAYAKFGMQLYF